MRNGKGRLGHQSHGASIAWDLGTMIEAVVRYLRAAGVPFRVTSYPSPEAEPVVALRLAPGTLLVDVHVVLVDGSPALACTPHGLPMNFAAFAMHTGTTVMEATPAELPPEHRGAVGPLPALGGVFGVPLFVDEQILTAPRVAFRAFGTNDVVELTYDDFALVERPRVAAFALGELPPHGA
jgi:prolyl-tRNA editing enzyme YbaK/EbsC (Cys-tRNA(Pro) deacylase)